MSTPRTYQLGRALEAHFRGRQPVQFSAGTKLYTSADGRGLVIDGPDLHVLEEHGYLPGSITSIGYVHVSEGPLKHTFPRGARATFTNGVVFIPSARVAAFIAD